MSNSAEVQRRHYAEDLWFVADVRSDAVKAAFAAVPRERFVGPGPWRIKSFWNMADYRTTPDDDPCHVYHDVLIALDESRNLNNGQPSLWAFVFDKLDVAANERVVHLGCGTGYYTAILAELVGRDGVVEAIEIEPGLAELARAALAPWPQVMVANGDGTSHPITPADVIVASAGATHPLPAWLEALKPGARLLFPMTPTEGFGAMLLVTRLHGDKFSARFLCRVLFYEFAGARDAQVGKRLAEALARNRGADVKSLRSDPHEPEESCWLHENGWCLSCREPAEQAGD